MNKIASAHTGNSSLIATLCFPVLTAFALLALMLFVGACSDDATEVPFPEQPHPEARNWLFTVYGTSANHVYAAGSKGSLFYYDGNPENTWTLVEVGTNQAITSIWDSGEALYATGHGGLVLRGAGKSWSSMTTGTTQDLFNIGRMKGSIYACGLKGTLLKLNGSTWGGTPDLSWILDESGAPSDTLLFGEDVASLTTVNSFFIGGAYNDPNFIGIPEGMKGTKGGVFELADHSSLPSPDPGAQPGDPYTVLPDWILRPLSGEQIVSDEWMLCSTSDPENLAGNFLGTSEGWLFQLSDAGNGKTVWTKFSPSVTKNPRGGIQSIWVDPRGDIYMVTDEGSIVYQTADYVFNEAGTRDLLHDSAVSLTGIWGTGDGTFYAVGYMDEMLLRFTHDPASGDFNITEIPVEFDADKAMDMGPTVDKFGRPLN